MAIPRGQTVESGLGLAAARGRGYSRGHGLCLAKAHA